MFNWYLPNPRKKILECKHLKDSCHLTRKRNMFHIPLHFTYGWFQTIAVSHNDGAPKTAIRHIVNINSDHAACQNWALPEVAICPMKSEAGIRNRQYLNAAI